MPQVSQSPQSFLTATYSQLEFDQGDLCRAREQPAKGSKEWVEKGDWQALAAQVGAERIFFVDGNPVVVFAMLENRGEHSLRTLYQRVWCMARPRLLFLARPGELAVYDLAKQPPRHAELTDSGDRLIKRVSAIADIQTALSDFHREQIETGLLLGDERFRLKAERSDKSLIRDLKFVRRALADIPAEDGYKKPSLSSLHSLLGRCIFARYLEDRDIINRDYFERVIEGHRRPTWDKILRQPLGTTPMEPAMGNILFLRILRSKSFTYAFFDQLARDFNGDTFPIDDLERECIRQEHLNCLLNFLCGNPSAESELFFYAYRFDIIPIELISSIYEEFYNERIGKDLNQGSHYTPPALVEFVLTKTLTAEVLAKRPRICDPACGSGIFLVESFRRIVRYSWAKEGGRVLSREELQKILRDQISGIDLNPEAVRVAAFSLYLAFLHYQRPRDINEKRQLPYLAYVDDRQRRLRLAAKPDSEFFDILLCENAFTAVGAASSDTVKARFGEGSADVVVGNPPWGHPASNDREGRAELAIALAWCEQRPERAVGDDELSQAFVHLATAILRGNGRAGLLLSSGVLFKQQKNSQKFRNLWLETSRLQHVVNFAHVRHLFFSGRNREAQGVAPFVSAVFEKATAPISESHRFEYWSAKRTAIVRNTESVVLNKGDLHYLKQAECRCDDRLWKIFWWGSRRDVALIQALDRQPALSSLGSRVMGGEVRSGMGFLQGNAKKPSAWLSTFKELPISQFRSYGSLNPRTFVTPPAHVARRGIRDVFEGTRILIRRGVPQGGHITARIDAKPYSFRHSIFGFRLEGFADWQPKIILGALWSSLGRYYLFSTSGSWGMWHDELLVDTVAKFPVAIPEDRSLAENVIRIVDELRGLDCEKLDLEDPTRPAKLELLEQRLDDAIFDLYRLDESERDLIRDCCGLGFDLLYRREESDAFLPVLRPQQSFGALADVKAAKGLGEYLSVLVRNWENMPGSRQKFYWRILSPPTSAPMLAIILQRRPPSESKWETVGDATAWKQVLKQLSEAAYRVNGTPSILTDTFFRHVSNDEILIVKRNERRFWTRTAARIDAEATFLQTIRLSEEVAA